MGGPQIHKDDKGCQIAKKTEEQEDSRKLWNWKGEGPGVGGGHAISDHHHPIHYDSRRISTVLLGHRVCVHIVPRC